jgi:hypothetical protein
MALWKYLKEFFISIDQFGEIPSIVFSVSKPMLKTSIGSLLTLVTIVIMFAISLNEIREVYKRSFKTFIVSTYERDLEKLGTINVDDYKTPFIYVLSMYNKHHPDFDIEDNRYVEIQANQYVTGDIV